MIKRLNIRDFAVIDELELEFDHGMTVLTGETGAGKSILIDALGLLLGDRAESGVIRDGTTRAEISALFDITTNPAVHDLLDEQAIDSTEPELMIRRVITKDGRSSAFVNSTPATAQLLRSIGENLIDIHGQHSHQSLSKPEIQRKLVDDYGNYPQDLAVVKTAYERWREATKQLQELQGDTADQDAALTLLRYQVDELKNLRPEPGEYELLDEEHRRLANGNRLLDTASNALRMFHDDDLSIHARLSTITAELKALQQYDAALTNLIGILDEATLQMTEAGSELRQYLDQLQIDPERLQVVEERLSLMHELARKHRIQPRELAAHLAELEQQLARRQNSRQLIEELRQTQSAALAQYHAAAVKLQQHRKKAAQKMSAEITTKLAALGMVDGKFAITAEPQDETLPKPYGYDRIEFLVTTNPGLGLQPLRKIASGGELSRISLAIQVIGTQDKGIPTLIFDEVDAGIGGAIAEIVGKLLHELARQRQVFCVTHLPQVAAQGDQHLLVTKSSTRTTTSTTVQALSAPQRIEEIARMLGGIKITDQSRRHAQEMLATAG
ncbi:MAG: recombination and repair protein [Gammaproteobacteria bacterium]|nr:recombination and repair protein [Gammaproteobacteria bacterium]